MRAGGFPVVLMAALAWGAAPLAAQAVFESKQGRAEVIGLRRWTVQMLADSVSAKAPGESLYSRACAAILQQKLGFPAAAVSIQVENGADGMRPVDVLITVVEPADSARVRQRRLSGGWRLPDSAWRTLRATLVPDEEPQVNAFLFALQLVGFHRIGMAEQLQLPPEMLADARPFWTSIAALHRPADLALARRSLAADTNWVHRLMAVAALANFRDRDAAWHLLAAGARDPEHLVRTAAVAALKTFLQGDVRRVDWTPAVADLRTLLGGSHVWGYQDVMAVLAGSRISPSLARTLLAGNSALLAAHLRAQNDRASAPALALARQLSGRPTATREAMLAWLRTLG